MHCRLLAIATLLLCAHGAAAETPVAPCTGTLAHPLGVLSTGWSREYAQTRHYDATQAGLTADDLPQLELQWVFAYRNTKQPRSLPAISEQAVFVGSQEGAVFALDRHSGCAYWRTQLRDAPIRNAIRLAETGGRSLLFFGDDKGYAYALDALTGEKLWELAIDSTPMSVITGSAVYHDGFVYVPASSFEVGLALKPWYGCCHFRGSISKIHALTGERVWQSFSIPAAPAPSIRNGIGVRMHGPSGAAVWSAPTLDIARQRLYFGTGQNYSSLTDGNSDAIHAIDLHSGERIWHRQFLAEDGWNPACNLGPLGANCPEEDGPDYDFGAPPMLVTRSDGSQLLVAGQKSGMVFAINPDTGETVWSQSVGRGGMLGGVHWGMASDGQFLYVPISDLDIWGVDTPGAARPALNKLDLATGEILWSVPAVFHCADDKGRTIKGCRNGLSAALTLIPGAVLAPGMDGVLRAYCPDSGRLLWEYDTKRQYTGVNGVRGTGGTLDAGGAVVAGGQLFIHSGYGGIISGGSRAGNVLLVFGKKPVE